MIIENAVDNQHQHNFADFHAAKPIQNAVLTVFSENVPSTVAI